MSTEATTEIIASTAMTRKEKQAANLKKVDACLHAFLDNYNKTKDRKLAIKAAARVCNSPMVISRIEYMVPPRSFPTIV